MQRVTTLELLKLAIPSIAFAILTNGYRLVDQFFIQHVSTAAQAAVGSSVFVLILFFAGFALVAFGVSPLVARATGAGDEEQRRAVIGTGLAGGLVMSVLFMLVGGLGAPVIADALGLQGDANAECVRYLTALSLTILPLVMTPLVDHAFISMGSARAPMVLHIISLAANVFLTWFLALYLEWGVVGAALASNGSRALTTSIGLVLLVKKIGLRWSHVRFGPQLRRILKVGAPITGRVAFYAIVYWGVLHVAVAPLGSHVYAALGIGFTALEGFTWPTFHGLSIAVGSFVGRALGAERVEDSWGVIRRALPFSTALGLGAAAAFWFGGPYLTGIFTEDPLVHRAATVYAQVLALSQLAVAWESLCDGVLEGAGDTHTVFWASTPCNLARVPLAWWLAIHLGLGAMGIWWAINITSYVKTGAKALLVLRGGWSRLSI